MAQSEYNLVRDLRVRHEQSIRSGIDAPLYKRAADEIERLEAELAQTKRDYQLYVDGVRSAEESAHDRLVEDLYEARKAARQMQLRWRAMHPRSLYLVEWAQRWPWLKEED